MPSSSEEFFFPCSLSQLAAAGATHLNSLKKSGKKERLRMPIIGRGTINVGKQEKKFFVIRTPIDDGTTGRFPIWVPENLVEGDWIEVLCVKGGPEVVVGLARNNKKMFTSLPTPRPDGGSHPISTRFRTATYKKIGKEWRVIKVDNITL